MKKLGVVFVTALVSACNSGGGGGAAGHGGAGAKGGSAAGMSGSGGAAGALGSGGAAPQGTPLTGIKAISAGGRFACALLMGGGVDCWGDNSKGQLGNGTTTSTTMAVPVSEISNATAIAAGNEYACALLADQTVSCWGDNSSFQLGNNNDSLYPTPVAVSGVSGATMIAASGTSSLTCAVVGGGMVRCWGEDAVSVVQDGGLGLSATPMTVPKLTGVTGISATEGLCVIVAGGQVECWNGNSQPSVVPGLTASAISGECALTPNGNLHCWDGTWHLSDAGLAELSGDGYTSVSDGSQTACAVQGPGGTSIICWGDLLFGQYVGGQAYPFSGMTGFSSVVVGEFEFAFAVMNDGTAQSAGFDTSGQLGNGMRSNSSSGPVLVQP